MVSGPLDQLLIFRQLYLIELLGFSARLGLCKLWHLLHIRLFTEFGMLVCVTNSNLMQFQFWYLAGFCLFSVVDCFGWFWMGSLCNRIKLMLEFLKASFLVLHFSYYTLVTFAIYADDTTLYSMCDQESDLWQQLELAAELESDL